MGDCETLKVNATLLGSNKLGTPGAGKHDMELAFTCGSGNILCKGTTTGALYDTDASGKTVFNYSWIGGCGLITCKANYSNLCIGNELSFYAKSPDITGNGKVSLQDLGPFTESYNECDTSEAYNPCCDFNSDGCCSLSDLGLLGAHYNHQCPASQLTSQNEEIAISDSEIKIQLSKSPDFALSHKYHAVIYLTRPSNLTTAAIGLSNEDPNIEYAGWTENTKAAFRAVAAPVINSGRKIVFIALWSEKALAGESIEIGTIELTALDGEEVDLSDNPLGLIFGDVLESSGAAKRIKGYSLENAENDEIPIRDYLGNNYPNPFNPSTVIEYSISKDSYIRLSIYNVNGQLIRTLVNGFERRSSYRVMWDGTDNTGKPVQSGVYLYRLTSDSFSQTKKLIILR